VWSSRVLHLSHAALRNSALNSFPETRLLLNENRTYVRFEGSTAVTMKNAVLWDIKTLFVLHRKHITSPLQSSAG
jgi:hypothetical protein